MSEPVPVQRLSSTTRTIKAMAALLAVAAPAAALGMLPPVPAQAAMLSPVYIHMNGANEFLERMVFVRPGQKVVFVNEDTGAHSIRGYDPTTGVQSKTFFEPVIKGTPGPQHSVHTYAISFAHQGVQQYYCPVHAYIAKGPGGRWLPVRRPTTHGFGAAMAGTVVVTNDKALLAENPKTASERILPKFFGG